jgi:hypothetical protein
MGGVGGTIRLGDAATAGRVGKRLGRPLPNVVAQDGQAHTEEGLPDGCPGSGEAAPYQRFGLGPR